MASHPASFNIVVSLTCTIYLFAAFVVSLVCAPAAKAQNLFANPGFEDINTCTEYHAPCAPEAWFYQNPVTNPLINGRAAPSAILGNNILLVPVANVYEKKNPAYRSHVYSMLACPLEAGRSYKLSFFLHTSKRKFYGIDFHFTSTDPAVSVLPSTGEQMLRVTPAATIAEMRLGWRAVEYVFSATTNAQYCRIGYFDTAALSFAMDERMNKSGDIFYCLDELKLQPVLSTDTCLSYRANIKKLYAQNYRHTEGQLALAPEMPLHKPVFLIDTVSIPSLFFQTGKSVIDQRYTHQLDTFITMLATKQLAKMEIIGHTDNVGSKEANLLLSESRSLALKEYLLQFFPQWADRIFVSGVGDSSPRATNNSPAGRALNRRVEIILTCTTVNE